MNDGEDRRTPLPAPLEDACRAVAQLGRKAAGRPVKHSVTIRGHATSVSLEAPFWDHLGNLAEDAGVPLAGLIAEIDAARGSLGLSNALRLFVLACLGHGDQAKGTFQESPPGE